MIKLKTPKYFAIFDRLKSKLKKKDNLLEKIYFLFIQLKNLTRIELQEQAKFLQKTYVDDLGKFFPNECVCFKAHIKLILSQKNTQKIQVFLVKKKRLKYTLELRSNMKEEGLITLALFNIENKNLNMTMSSIKLVENCRYFIIFYCRL